MRTNSEYILTEWLVLQAQAGHAEAFNKLIRIWYPKLIRYAEFQMKNSEDAKDMVQESLVVVARKLKELKDPITFPKWIYTILHRRGVDKQRKEIRKREVIDASKNLDIEYAENKENSIVDSRIDLVKALQKLDKTNALLVHLHYLEGLTMQEIASVVDIPAGTVKSRLYTARKKLKQLLAEYAR